MEATKTDTDIGSLETDIGSGSISGSVLGSGSVVVEVCVDGVESAVEAERGEAHRVELCSALFEGGLTPSVGVLRAARKRVKIPIFVIIRPRAGDFFYSEAEFEAIKYDVEEAVKWGANGIVFGALTEDGDVDIPKMKEIIRIAHPLPITFHRAFDMARDPLAALETLIQLGVHRVLTSGQERSAIEGLDLIKQLIEVAGNRICVMPGGGITDRNIKKVIQAGAKEVHLSARVHSESPMKFRNTRCFMGGELRQSEYTRAVVGSHKVQALVHATNLMD